MTEKIHPPFARFPVHESVTGVLLLASTLLAMPSADSRV